MTLSPSQADRIPGELLKRIDEAIERYPMSSQSASLPILHLWQNHFGFIDNSAIEWIAAKLGLQPIDILELVSFYPWFRQQAAGQVVIRVCHTLSCAMAGSEQIHETFCKAANVPYHPHQNDTLPTSADGKFSIEFVECLASCGTAPVCLIQEDLLENVAPENIPDILNHYSN
ncbi:MAG: NAD(P)H-dependent oxidoreductase subunit E [Verrucomicrobia bacterium]|nr:MAG: NAD(P)H-dependent oxidoreductase subunit E [Verrucomicrobiota bacterium]